MLPFLIATTGTVIKPPNPDINPNDNDHLTTTGMLETLVLAAVTGFVIMAIFEKYRFYKQIYLKRLQNRFRLANRVPPYPAETFLGWFWEIQKVSEKEVLRMVGLDAYMCLRYIVVCYKFAIFLSVWGLIVLLLLYSTVKPIGKGPINPWDTYTISNVLLGSEQDQARLWLTAISFYVFALYFCRLLHAEYNHFSVKRLHYLVQKEADAYTLDPDTPPQKSFTVMIERIPNHLRSAQALFEYFEKMFPGDVYTVEIALDLHDLDAKTAKRKRLRDKLEKAIAHYEATNERLQIYAHTGNYGEDDTKDGFFGDDGFVEFIAKNFFAPEKYGYEKVDALNYYTHKLLKYNDDVKQLQNKYYESMTNLDKDLQRRLNDGYDTRMAALFHAVKEEGSKTIEEISQSTRTSRRPSFKQPPAQHAHPNLPPRPPVHASQITTSAPAPASAPAGQQLPPRPSFQQQQEQKSFVPAQHQQRFSAAAANASHPPLPPQPQRRGSLLAGGGGIAAVFSKMPQIEDMLFGPTNMDYRTAYEAEMSTLRQEEQQHPRRPSIPTVINPAQPPAVLLQHQQEAQQVLDAAAVASSLSVSKDEPVAEKTITAENLERHNNSFKQRDHATSSAGSNPPSLQNESQQQQSQQTTTIPVETIEPFSFDKPKEPKANNNNNSNDQQQLPTITEERDDHADMDQSQDPLIYQTVSDDTHLLDSSSNAPEVHPIVSSLFAEDKTIQEWIKRSSLDNDVTELLESAANNNNSNGQASMAKRRGSSYASMDNWKRDSQSEMRAYLDNTSGTPRNSFVFGSSHSKRPSNPSLNPGDLPSRESSAHGYGHGNGPDGEASAHGDPEMKRANYLSSMAKSLLSRDSRSGAQVMNDSSTHSYRSRDSASRYSSAAAAAAAAASAGNGFGAGAGIASRNPSSHGFPANYLGDDTSQHNNSYGFHVDMPQYLMEEGQDQAQLPPPQQEERATREAYFQTSTGGLTSILPVGLTDEQLAELTKLSIQRAKLLTEQTKHVAKDAWQPLMEIERLIEMVTLGAYYKYSSTAFVTFKSRVNESIAQQMLLSPDAMEINHAPNPKDIIWDNVAIPKSQIVLRRNITNIGVIVGSIFWSSLVNSVNTFASFAPLPTSQQQTMSAVVMLIFLLLLPFVFDSLARYYEGYKLESEIQNSIMTRYFYYQLINVYVTVGFSGSNLWGQLLQMLEKPQTLIDIVGGRLPNVSLFFTSLMIVKIFVALPLEMVRPWQLSTIFLMSTGMDRRRATRRDLRTGAFYSWPMLYGWIYPQLMMVLMIMVTYCCITPLLMPFCAIFFAGAYVMYKYQLLYVYINEYQSGGYMWYAVFNRSLVALEFASVCLIGYFTLQLGKPGSSGPFFIMLPLPIGLIYFGRYCEHKLKKATENLSYGFARTLDAMNQKEKAEGLETPVDSFTKECYRQPSLTEPEVLPEPYRNDGSYDIIRSTTGEVALMHDFRPNKRYLGSISINVHELVDEGEENPLVLKQYFEDTVLPLSVIPPPSSEHGDGSDGEDDERRPLTKSPQRRRSSAPKASKPRPRRSAEDSQHSVASQQPAADDLDVEDPPMTRARR